MQRTFASLRRPQGHPIRQQIRDLRAQALTRDNSEDLRLFALSFTAFFVCIYTLIF